jgi:nucleotide-binding universal stress UspA family protein
MARGLPRHSIANDRYVRPMKRSLTMTAPKILVPTDFSPASEACLQEAGALAKERGGSLFLLHVAQPPMTYGPGVGVPAADAAQWAASLEQVAPPQADVPCQRRVVIGDPAAEIVSTAEQEGIDMIVMGTHGRTGLGRLLMGSVAEAVVRRAPCPVLTIKYPAIAHAEQEMGAVV